MYNIVRGERKKRTTMPHHLLWRSYHHPSGLVRLSASHGWTQDLLWQKKGRRTTTAHPSFCDHVYIIFFSALADFIGNTATTAPSTGGSISSTQRPGGCGGGGGPPPPFRPSLAGMDAKRGGCVCGPGGRGPEGALPGRAGAGLHRGRRAPLPVRQRLRPAQGDGLSCRPRGRGRRADRGDGREPGGHARLAACLRRPPRGLLRPGHRGAVVRLGRAPRQVAGPRGLNQARL
mmetsp:Transcript_8950/g.14979  ORF Transcript_8950/g.14979 Transcript_8950/m.14979 type:complete len:232 (-) Transcript_8950:735-1430(-)